MSEPISGINRYWDSQFIMTKDLLKTLTGILEKYANIYEEEVKLKFQVWTQNNFYYYTDSIDDVLSERNPVDNPITKVAFLIEELNPKKTKEPYDRDWIFFLELGNANNIASSNLRLYCRTEDKNWNTSLLSEITPVIEKSVNRSNENVMVFGMALIALCWGSWKYLLKEFITPIANSGMVSALDVAATVFFIFILMGFITKDKDFSIAKIFYKSYFSWGREAEVIEKQKARYRNTAYTVIFGVMSSLIATYIFQFTVK